MIGTLAFEFQRRGKKKKDEEEKKAGLEHTRESLILIRALILILIFADYANPVCSSPSASVVAVISSFYFFYFFFFTRVFLFPQRRCLLPQQAFCAL
jgi:ACR3 family arsenite efflux pump ArsB